MRGSAAAIEVSGRGRARSGRVLAFERRRGDAEGLRLLGLVAAVPAIGPASRTPIGRLGVAAMGLALVLQWISIWDYAAESQRTAGPIAEAAPRVGRGVRVAALLGDLRTRFRVNPALHAACWLGIAGDNVVWNNYETRHYYFPVQFRPGLSGPSSYDLEGIALLGVPHRAEGARIWEGVLATSHDAIDVLLVWRGDEALGAVTGRWFEPVEQSGGVTIFRPREDR